jgi:hypothetical protein
MMVCLMVGRSSALSYNARAEMVVPSNSRYAVAVCAAWSSRNSVKLGGIPTDTGDRAARGELIAYLALRFTAEDFPRLSSISNSIC